MYCSYFRLKSQPEPLGMRIKNKKKKSMKKCGRTCKKQVSLKKLEERGANCIEEEEATETLLLYYYSELKEGQYMKGRGVEVVYHMGKVIP